MKTINEKLEIPLGNANYPPNSNFGMEQFADHGSIGSLHIQSLSKMFTSSDHPSCRIILSANFIKEHVYTSCIITLPPFFSFTARLSKNDAGFASN